MKHGTGSDKWSELMDACLSLDAEVTEVRRLIAAGADVNATTGNGYTALHLAAMADWNEDEDGRMTVLLEAGANVEARAHTQAGQDWTPLMLAAAEGYAAQLRTLIEWGSDVNAVDESGRSALMLAVSQGLDTDEKVRFLLNADANVHLKCREGKKALDYATEYIAIMKTVKIDGSKEFIADIVTRVLGILKLLA